MDGVPCQVEFFFGGEFFLGGMGRRRDGRLGRERRFGREGVWLPWATSSEGVWSSGGVGGPVGVVSVARQAKDRGRVIEDQNL